MRKCSQTEPTLKGRLAGKKSRNQKGALLGISWKTFEMQKAKRYVKISIRRFRVSEVRKIRSFLHWMAE